MSRDVNTFTVIGNIVSKKEPNPGELDILWVEVATASNDSSKSTVRVKIKVCVQHIVEMIKATPVNARCVFIGEFSYNKFDQLHLALLAPAARFYKVENGSKDPKS